jgi:hypothetical protein
MDRDFHWRVDWNVDENNSKSDRPEHQTVRSIHSRNSCLFVFRESYAITKSMIRNGVTRNRIAAMENFVALFNARIINKN